MKKVFRATCDGHQIVVENKWFTGEKLYVNGELQDENVGLAFSRATLTGKLIMDHSEMKDIKVTVGGNLRVHCRVFVDNELIPSYKIKKMSYKQMVKS